MSLEINTDKIMSTMHIYVWHAVIIVHNPGDASLGILTSISVTAYGAVLHSKCKELLITSLFVLLL